MCGPVHIREAAASYAPAWNSKRSAAESDPARQSGSLARGESRRNRIAIKHPHGIERILVQVVTDERQLFQYVAGCRNDVTADTVRMENIEHLTGACPDELSLRKRFEHLNRVGHERQGVHARISDASRKHGDKAGDLRTQRGHDFPDLRQGHDGGDVELDTPAGEPANQRIAWLASRIRDRNLHVHIVRPARDLQRLTFHLSEFIAYHFERHGLVPDLHKDLAGERPIIRYTRLAHESWVRSQAFDVALRVHFQHVGLIRAVRKDLDFQAAYRGHRGVRLE